MRHWALRNWLLSASNWRSCQRSASTKAGAALATVLVAVFLLLPAVLFLVFLPVLLPALLLVLLLFLVLADFFWVAALAGAKARAAITTARASFVLIIVCSLV
jgi:fatty acid desaturase